jgi:hypothetical protein
MHKLQQNFSEGCEFSTQHIVVFCGTIIRGKNQNKNTKHQNTRWLGTALVEAMSP